MEYKIMLVEDDEKLRSLISQHLAQYGYIMILPDDFQKVIEQFEKEEPHLILLDINLTYYDGFYLCKVFRKKSKAPILFLSARNSSIEQVHGMELGADDFLVKPVDLEILLSKVRATLRRVYGEYAGSSEQNLSVSGLCLNENTFRMYYRDKSTELTKNELKLFKKLMAHHDQVVTREALLSELWDENVFIEDNTLTVNVTRIKAKCEELGIPDLIKTKRGAGYSLDSSCLKEA